jgi:RHS repeat-associated protein
LIFNDNGSTGVDYAYDHNGNLIKDLNKKIEKITYNRLNLPVEVIFTGKGKITYTYNAAGVKLSKTVAEIGKPTKTISYANGFLYENGELKEFGTAEGRLVNDKQKGLLYQYHYKDHLGNVRMTFAPDVPQTERLRLTAEVDSANKEEKDFSNLVATRTAEKSLAGVRAAKINSQQSVSSRLLRVQKGGSLAIEAFATFDNEKIINPIESLPTVAEKVSKMAITAGALLSVQDINFGNEIKSKTLNLNMLAVFPFVKNLFSKAKSKDNITIPYKPQKPKAYIEIAVYSDSLQTELLSIKQLPITQNAEYFWEKLQDSLLIEEDGFAVVSLRNESEKEVLFDELNVTVYGTERATIIQENHYEPFGMTLRGLDYVLEEKQKNRFLYNGKELDESLDLQLYDYHARQVDIQTGRFNQIDPHAHKYRMLSGYVYVANNPMKYIDPDGKDIGINYGNNQQVRLYYDEKNKKMMISYNDVKGKLVTSQYTAGMKLPEHIAKADKGFVGNVLKSMDFILKNDTKSIAMNVIKANNFHVNIVQGTKFNENTYVPNAFSSGGTLTFNPYAALKVSGGLQSPTEGFFHEISHANRHREIGQGFLNEVKQNKLREENRALGEENYFIDHQQRDFSRGTIGKRVHYQEKTTDYWTNDPLSTQEVKQDPRQ